MAASRLIAGDFPSPSPKLSPRQIDKMAERLSVDNANHKQATLSKLREKYLFAMNADKGRKKLNTEEQAESVSKLYENSRKHKDTMMDGLNKKYLEALQHNGKQSLTKEEMENSVEKLYGQAISQKKSNLAKLEGKYMPDNLVPKLNEEQMSESVQRLTVQQASHHEAMLVGLKSKYLFKHPNDSRPKLTKEQLQSMRERLCNVPKKEGLWPLVMSTHTREKLQRLYVDSTVPEFKKVSPDAWNQTVSRLYGK